MQSAFLSLSLSTPSPTRQDRASTSDDGHVDTPFLSLNMRLFLIIFFCGAMFVSLRATMISHMTMTSRLMMFDRPLPLARLLADIRCEELHN